MSVREERIQKVKDFQLACKKAGFEELAENVFELRGPFSQTLTLCTLVHGNEIGGMEVFLNLLSEFSSQKIKLTSHLRLMLGNVEAYYEDKRFIESDMNRSFGLGAHETREEIRAQVLEKFLENSDVLIDIHQTIGPTSTPFFIFEYDEGSYDLARQLHPEIPVVTYKGKRDFKGMTSTGFVISKKGLAVTIETGRKSIDDVQISLGTEIAKKAFAMNFKDPLPKAAFHHTYTFSQIISNPDRSLEMVKKFDNFEAVKKNDILARNAVEEIKSEVDGVILFAKYGAHAKTSSELALILTKVQKEEDLP